MNELVFLSTTQLFKLL